MNKKSEQKRLTAAQIIKRNRDNAHNAFSSLGRSYWNRAIPNTKSAHLLQPLLRGFELTVVGNEAFGEAVSWGMINPAHKQVMLNPVHNRVVDANEYLYILGHLALHLGLEHHLRGSHGDTALDEAREIVVDNMLGKLDIGRRPLEWKAPLISDADEETIANQLRNQGQTQYRSLAGINQLDYTLSAVATGYNDLFAQGIQGMMSFELSQLTKEFEKNKSMAQRARDFIINYHPLLGAMAARIEIVTDPQVCAREDIHMAAVNPTLQEIYLNPRAGLTLEEMVFTLGHELLHLGLKHAQRINGRNPFIWNLSCDFAINSWLVEMGVGQMPPQGLMYDPKLKGLSADEIYSYLIQNPSKTRRVRTTKGLDQGDILFSGVNQSIYRGDVSLLEDAYLEALRYGLEAARLRAGTGGALAGKLPADLIEEIRALSMKPVPWDVKLARWFEEYVPATYPQRTYARASRRQAASPDIARPRYYYPEQRVPSSTFGVVLDTSGSMERELLAKALGAISSYAQARGVSKLRLIHCDVLPYDDGYVAPDDLMHSYPVKGRGGTVLQPAIDYLLAQRDFPADAPVLVITDGAYEEYLRVNRPHAFILPAYDTHTSRWEKIHAQATVFRAL